MENDKLIQTECDCIPLCCVFILIWLPLSSIYVKINVLTYCKKGKNFLYCLVLIKTVVVLAFANGKLKWNES